MDGFNGAGFHYQGGWNVQWGGYSGLASPPLSFPQPAPTMAAPSAFNAQMMGAIFRELLQVLSQLQNHWAGMLGGQPETSPFFPPPPPPPPPQPRAEAAAYAGDASGGSAAAAATGGQVNVAVAITVNLGGAAQEQKPPEPPQPQEKREESSAAAAAAVAAKVEQSPAEAAAAAAVFSGGGDGGDGGGGDGGDPIILDLNGDNQLDVTGAQGKKIDFNLFGNGTPVKTEWLKAGTRDGLLVSDFNGDGKIDSGRELMRTTGVNGEQGKFKGGWDKLAQLFDKNHDGKVAGDELQNLQVWVDKDGDGQSEEGELQSVSQLGISQIDVPTEGVRSNFTMNGRQQLAEDYVFDIEVGGQEKKSP